MPQKFSNAARALLTAAITPSATSFSVESSKADLFPVANAGTATLPSSLDWFKAVLQDGTGDYEIVYVRTRASGSATFSNVLRGQEGTTARSWAAGTVVGLRVTAGDMDAVTRDNAASSATYTYDSEGRVSSISETMPTGTRTTTYTYDAQGRVTQAVQTLGSTTKTTTYVYDANGVLTGFTVTES